MGAVGLLVAKDLKRKLRSPLGLAISLAFPVVFAAMIALVFGAKGDAVPKVRLLLENRDDGILANALGSAFTSQQAAQYFDVRTVGRDEGRPRIDRGEASALLIIPEGFTRDLLDGKAVTLGLVRNPAAGILPEVAEQIASILAAVLDGGVRVLREPLDEVRPLFGEGGKAPSDASIAGISIAFKRAIESAGTFVLPPAITLEGAFEAPKGGDEKGRGTGALFLLVLPGIAVYALFMVGDNAMRDVLAEGTAGTLRRQLAGPIGAGTVVAAKALFAGIVSLASLAILSAIAAVFVSGTPNVAGFLLLSLALILAIVGTSSVIYGLAKTERRGATCSSIVYLAMGFLGGSFVPAGNLPPTMRAISRFTPFFWGTDGFGKLLQDGAGLAKLLPNVAVLGVLGAVLLAAGAVLMNRAVRRGGAAA
jgi:ABC-2 type transport system permease protein